MKLLDAFAELCETEGLVGEIATKVGEGLFECGHGIADVLEGFAEKLGDIETDLIEDGEESCWAADRLSPEFDEDPNLSAMRTAVDSIVGVCDSAVDKINEATLNLMEKMDKE
jgi:hypothetical protein